MNNVVHDKHQITVDLSDVDYMTAGAALLLFAEVSSAQIATSTGDITTIVPPTNKELAEKFADTGLITALKPGTTGKLKRLWETRSLFQSGTNPTDCIMPTIAILEQTSRQFPVHLTTAISEAMLNATQHAYSEFQEVQPEMNGRWWQYCYIHDDALSFLIYDIGAGIPTSLKKNNVLPGAAAMLALPHAEDKDLIAHAMKKGISRLSTQGRGQGSEDMKRPALRQHDNLLIISGNGRYQLLATELAPQLETLPFSIRGTFIEWTLELNE